MAGFKQDKGYAECAKGNHDYQRCLVKIPEFDKSGFAIGPYALGSVCKRCGHVDDKNLEFRSYAVGGRLMRFADASDYGEDMPVVDLPSHWGEPGKAVL